MRALTMFMAIIALAGCGATEAPEAQKGTTLWHEEHFGAEPSHRAVFDYHQDCRRFVAAMDALERQLNPDVRWFCT